MLIYLKTLPSILNGTNDSIVQDEAKASFASNISREDEKINWNQDAQVIHNHIRGLSPWPVAYTIMDDKNLKYMVRTSFLEKGEPGTIVETTKKAIIVATASEECIALTDIQLAGKTYASSKLFKWCSRITSWEEISMTNSIRGLAFETIQAILDEGAYSNLEINEVLSTYEISDLDKGLFTELVYGTVKRKYTLDFYLKPFLKRR